MLITPTYRAFEVEIVATKGRDKNLLKKSREVVEEYKRKLDYIMTRFMEDFGPKLDFEATRNEVYVRFTAVKSNEYANAARFLRLVTYYEGQA